jgi:hypothetical protein
VSRYAESTGVPADRTRNEIERTLTRYGAQAFAYGWESGRASILFQMQDRRIRFLLPLPDRQAREFTHAPQGRVRASAQAEEAYQQAVRQRWRALLLVIKAKLEAVETGITSLEQEFLGNICLPSGETVGEWVGPQIEEVYRTGQMPRCLPGVGVPALGVGE